MLCDPVSFPGSPPITEDKLFFTGLQSVAREGWQMLGSAWSQQHPASQTSPLGRKKDTAQLGSTTGDPGPSVGTKSITGLLGTSISTPKRSSKKDKDCRGLKTELFPSLHGPSICF